MPEKVVNLYREDAVEAWFNARAAVERELDEDPTDQDVLLELAAAYTGWRPTDAA